MIIAVNPTDPVTTRLLRPGRVRFVGRLESLLTSAVCLAVILGSGGNPQAFAAPEPPSSETPSPVDFNRDIRPILSQNCFYCHGPDGNHRKGGPKKSGGLRLDTRAGERQDLGGYAAVTPGKPEASELIRRIHSADAAEKMPPPDSGKKLTPAQQELLRRWVAEGARFSNHWSYEKPVCPPLPEVHDAAWPRNAVDRFILARLEAEGLSPQPEADRYTLARRAALDLTGLPPSFSEVDAFVNDPAADAFERYVDLQLAKSAYGEHWARMWLDLARYADSAGYADDPPRTIWPYRDYVIRAFNEDMPFDQFTIEQLAGDLLPHPTEEQIKATAFHRNTMTNSEGGTSDEEFRNVAIVDRVNTTFAVWMGTSIACAQCHNHKYDPISQKEYFQVFDFFNNTADADRPDEAPILEFYPEDLKKKRDALEAQFVELDRVFQSPAPQWVDAAAAWARVFPAQLEWRSPRPSSLQAESGAHLEALDDASIKVSGTAAGVSKDTYIVEIPFDAPATLTGLRLEALADDALEKKGPGLAGNFVVRRIHAEIRPVPNDAGPPVRYVRIELPHKGRLALAEVQVFSSGENIAPTGKATQSSTHGESSPSRANDGATEDAPDHPSVAQTGDDDPPWWELDLGTARPLERVVVWGPTAHGEGNESFHILALDADHHEVWDKAANPAPKPSSTFDLTGFREIEFATAAANVNQGGLDEALVVTDHPRPSKRHRDRQRRGERGWAIGDATGRDHSLIMVAARPVEIPGGATLTVRIEQQSGQERQFLGHFRLSVTRDARIAQHADTPPAVLAALAVEESQRDTELQKRIVDYFVRNIAPGLESERERLAELQNQRDAIKPFSVPILRELDDDKRRTTRIQIRGSFLATTDEVTADVPAAWHPLPKDAPHNRLSLARWMVAEENPLTPRVIANRFWQQIFGVGIVRTVEEFGSQGDRPVNQDLLDWLACDLVAEHWDVKRFLKLLVTSAAYRQSSRVTALALEKDPDNRLLSRGPRFRMTAEMIRDQALAAAGLLSHKIYGPSVRPPRPNLDLRAAFGGNLDWQASTGEDRYRRGLYTEWRRTSPYPSMATFDAPNREVCTLRRNRSNTPLQALVTLNDPVFIEAAQGLAREMMAAGDSPAARIRCAFRRVLARPASPAEALELARLESEAKTEFARHPDRAQAFAAEPLGPPPNGTDLADLAAWTAVANVVLNLDETLMKR